MAKKSTKKGWAWVKTEVPGQPGEPEKSHVLELFAPYVRHLQDNLPPLEEPQRYNQAIGVEARWRGRYFTLVSIYKVAPRPSMIQDSFREGFARLTYKAPGVYDLAYFRHTGQWFTVAYDIPLQQCFEWVKKDPIFAV